MQAFAQQFGEVKDADGFSKMVPFPVFPLYGPKKNEVVGESGWGESGRMVVPLNDTVGEIVEIVYGLRNRTTITAEFARRDRCF